MNTFFTLVHTDKSNDALISRTKEKIKDHIRLINNDSDRYDEKSMKIKFNSDDDLPLKKTRIA